MSFFSVKIFRIMLRELSGPVLKEDNDRAASSGLCKLSVQQVHEWLPAVLGVTKPWETLCQKWSCNAMTRELSHLGFMFRWPNAPSRTTFSASLSCSQDVILVWWCALTCSPGTHLRFWKTFSSWIRLYEKPSRRLTSDLGTLKPHHTAGQLIVKRRSITRQSMLSHL